MVCAPICLLKMKIRILWKIFEVILKELDLKSQHITLFIFWEAWYWASHLKMTRLLIPFITFKIDELLTFYVKKLSDINIAWSEMRKGKSENNWGSFDCGKILYWNKIPVITLLYSSYKKQWGKGRGVEIIWHEAITLWEPAKFSSSWQVSAKRLGRVSRLWFALRIPPCKCHCVNRRVLHSCAALGAPSRGCGSCLGKRECVQGWQRRLASFQREGGEAGLGSALSRPGGAGGCTAVQPGWRWRSAPRCRKHPAPALPNKPVSIHQVDLGMPVCFYKYGTLNVPCRCWLGLLNTDEDGFFLRLL